MLFNQTMHKSIEILFIITFMFLGFVSNDDTEPEVEDLVDRYELIMASDSGYGKPEVLQTTEELRDLSTQTLKNMITIELKYVQCGYVYSVLHLLTLLENLIELKGLSFLVRTIAFEKEYGLGKKKKMYKQLEFSSRPISIYTEAIVLLASVYRFESRLSLNLMWLFYFYAESLENYDFVYHYRRKEKNVSELKLLINELNNFEKEYCQPNNAFNNRFFKSIYYNDLIDISEHTDPETGTFIVMSNRKPEIKARVVKDKDSHTYLSDTMIKFDIHRLRLNEAVKNEEFMKCLLNDFGKIENWKDIRDKLVMHYDKSRNEDALVDRLINLAAFHQNFIKLLQILTLQVTWSRLVRIRKFLFDLKASATTAIKHFQKTSRKFSAYMNMKRLVKDLTYFMDYLSLHDDIRFNIYIQEVRKIKEITVGNLNRLIESTETTLNSFYAAFFNCTSTFRSEDYKFLASTLLSARINVVMYGIDFSVIQTFIDFTEYLQTFKRLSPINENEGASTSYT